MKSMLYLMLGSGIFLIAFSYIMMFLTKSQNPFVWIFVAGLSNITVFAWLYAKYVIKPYDESEENTEEQKSDKDPQ